MNKDSGRAGFWGDSGCAGFGGAGAGESVESQAARSRQPPISEIKITAILDMYFSHRDMFIWSFQARTRPQFKNLILVPTWRKGVRWWYKSQEFWSVNQKLT